jgi:transketolase
MEKSHKIAKLEETARKIRVETIKSLYKAQSGHPGGSLSMVDLITALYFGGVLKHDPKDPAWEERDYFLLSNGHAVPGLYACLAVAGYYPVSQLDRLREIGSPMPGHPLRGSFPGIEISSGSLGQGLPMAVGLALGLKLRHKKNRVVVITSDGEHEAGATWEAIMYAPKHRLDNLTVIVDKNGTQINGPTREIVPNLDPLAAKYRACGWETAEIDGHDFEQILAAFAKTAASGPFAVIARTVTAKGIAFMEGDFHWHHRRITKEIFEGAMKNLGAG